MERPREIIEIGAILINQFGSEISRFQSFVRPAIHPYLSHYCQRLTGISPSDVEGAANFEKVFRRFQNWHNRYDSQFVMASWGERDIEFIEDELDHYRMYDILLPDNLDCKAAYRTHKGLNKKVGLLKALRMENMEFEGEQHRALDDAVNLLRLFRKFIDIWPI